MSRTYSRTTCYICGKQHSRNGLAETNHMRKHVREGILREVKSSNIYANILFMVIDQDKIYELYPRKQKDPQ